MTEVYNFVRRIKCICTIEEKFSIEADSEEKAAEEAKKYTDVNYGNGTITDMSVDDVCGFEPLEKEQYNGDSTVVVYDDYGGNAFNFMAEN